MSRWCGDRLWHETVDPECPRISRDRGKADMLQTCQIGSNDPHRRSQGRRSSASLKIVGSRTALFVVPDAATQIADLRDEAFFRNRRLVCARLWKHVVDRRNLLLRLLGGGVKFHAPCLAINVFLGPNILAKICRIRVGVGIDLSVAKIEAKWIQVAILKATLSLSKHIESFGLICIHSSDGL